MAKKSKKKSVFTDVDETKNLSTEENNINSDNVSSEKSIDELNNVSNLQDKLAETLEIVNKLKTENEKLTKSFNELKENHKTLENENKQLRQRPLAVNASSLENKKSELEKIKLNFEKATNDLRNKIKKIRNTGIDRRQSGDGYDAWN